MDEIRFLPCGECAMTVAFPQEIREDTNRKIRFLAEKIKQEGIRGVRETVPTFCSMTVYYDPLVISAGKLEKHIRRLLGTYRADNVGKKRVFRIPVCYDGEYAPDMADVCAITGLSKEQVIALHAGNGLPHLYAGLPAGVSLSRRYG